MSDERAPSLSAVRSVVVKLGTQLLTGRGGRLDEPFLSAVANQVAALRGRGVVVTIVSSGAVAAGVAELSLPGRPTDLAKLQAVAAVGQRRLMDAWAAAFAPHDLHVAQLLLTREDVDDRQRFLNLRNTLHAVHDLGGVPVINENDTVSTDEIVRISFGDNDVLAALVTHALAADLLVLLSVVDGIQGPDGQPVRLVDGVDAAREWVRAEKSPLGKGGMDSKLTAARMVTDAGSAMVVADGRQPEVLLRLLDGGEVGTLFVPGARRRPARSRWIGSARPVGTITVDAGAVAALTERNRSLLPAGITAVAGPFARGDVVAVAAPDGRTVARGLTNYAAAEVDRIKGFRTADVRALLSDAAYDEVVHRDNLVLE
jgi:glutamate 5-kinase